MKLNGRAALVTGGARGIGAAIARHFFEEGASVMVADVLENEAAVVAEPFGKRGSSVVLDVRDQQSIDAAVQTVVGRFGRIDILVNNAAVFDMAPLLEITPESYERVFAVNVKGLLFTLQAVAREMVGQRSGGKIINIASQAGRRGEPQVAVYCASKAAVISITQSAGLALIGHGINVNGISPGVVDTPMWDDVDALFARYEGRAVGEKKGLVGAAVPFGRMGLPEDHVGAAVFLASADSDYVVAQTLNVDGGNWMS
jgi:NAD(P)-dependent dehydrogenase (short-subunit alcohol dehydrogenase family)